jgi:endonuclease III
VRDFLCEVSANGVPTTLDDCLCFYGMLKKSACLFLGVVFNHSYGIPVDRHLVAAFVNCSWVHPSCNNTTDPTLLSDMVECWLPKHETGHINNVVAGVRQLFQNSRFREQIKKIARQCGPKHLVMLEKVTKDLAGLWVEPSDRIKE